MLPHWRLDLSFQCDEDDAVRLARVRACGGVWESEEAFRRFGETLIPILQEVGAEGEPEIYPAHTFVAA